ncbi:uncharacterized protein LOC118448493 [Vespa mandarinia]|uniref:uncharacterized protein LOC118448493 n=1 Tax=Vespa mandarinia TaxID=7446 RepID=UPI001609CE9E|nr:uncharacterized protein LOC118448493 [Vespa mandarinia]
MSSLLFHHWIAGWLLLAFFGSKMSDCQNLYLMPYGTYYEDYRIESNDRVKYDVPETYYQYSPPVDSDLENNILRKNHLNFSPSSSSNYDYVAPSQDILDKKRRPDKNDEDNVWLDEEILEKMNMLERMLSDESNEKDFETKNSINDKIISESIMPEETKRVVRQVRKQRPGFFWTLAKIAFETFNDTQSAIKQISSIISNSIGPDTTTSKSMISDSLMESSKTSMINERNETTMTTEATMTNMKQTPLLTRSELQSLITRNIKGLIRLFNIEWQDALKQSDVNVNEFRKDLGKQVGTYLQDNPNAY